MKLFEIYQNIINEIFEKNIETKYRIKLVNNIIIYRFATSRENIYDLEFHQLQEFCNTEIYGKGKFSDIFPDRCKDKNSLLMAHIAFTPSKVPFGDRDKPEIFQAPTNEDEVLDLMGRISYLIKEFIKNHTEYDIFVVGKNSPQIQLNMYNKIFEHQFLNFYKLEGKSIWYNKGAFYFIKK